MRLLAVESDGVALHALGAKHRAERKAHAFENRALLDVQLKICSGILPLGLRISDGIDGDAAVGQRIFKANAVSVGAAAIRLR